MTSLDRYQCLLSSKYLDFYFRPTVGKRYPLSLATPFRAINCDLMLQLCEVKKFFYHLNKTRVSFFFNLYNYFYRALQAWNAP